MIDYEEIEDNKIDEKQLHKEFCILMFISIIALFIAIVWRKCISLYPETGIVTSIEREEENYIIEFTLSNGNSYLYETTDGDFAEGDFFSILFDSNYTETVKDDKILKIKYSGF